jgi:hypothetical protein
MDSKHWDWGKGFCRKHLGNGVPCQVCIATNDPDLERTREEWAALIGENPCKEVVGEYFDWKSVRPIGEPIKGSWSPGGTVNPQNIKKDFRIDGDTRVKGIFVIEGYDGDGNLIETIRGENTVSNEGFERMLDIDFSKLPRLPMSYCDPLTGHWIPSAESRGSPKRDPRPVLQ